MDRRHSVRAFGDAAPAIVRLAGLPAEVVEALRSPLCRDAAQALEEIESQLTEARGELAEQLHTAVHLASPAERNLLLAVKRDVYNGRPLGRRRGTRDWPAVERSAPGSAAEVCRLEDLHARRLAELTALFGAENARARRSLMACLDHPELRRGLALASPHLTENLTRHGAGEALSKRRLARAEETLLRYVSRTSLKLSPFSTLTPVGLGLACAAADPPPGCPGETVSLLAERPAGSCQLRRYSWYCLRCFFTLLKHHPPFRRRLGVRRNDTLELLEPGRYRLVRPFDWELDAEKQEIRHVQESVVKIGLAGPLADHLLGAAGSWDSLAALERHLRATTGLEPEEIEKNLGRLLRAGVLLLAPPWASTDFDPERRLREFLARGPEDDALGRELASALRGLEAAMAEEPTAETAPRIRARLVELIADCYAILGRHLGLADLKTEIKNNFHEDVYLTSNSPSGYGEIARISLASAHRALRSIRPVVLFSDLHYTRYEFLLSLRALLVRRWPGKKRIPFLAVMNESQALWRDHVGTSTANIQAAGRETWNPLDLEEIRELQQLRDRVTSNLVASLHPEGRDFAYDLEAAERAVAEIPAYYRPTFGPCLFMQPAVAGEDLWVLNHLLDGTGRFSTRYTKVMPEAQRARYTEHFSHRAHFAHWKGEAELVDIFCSRGDQLNVHALQTPRVVELPGERLELPPERVLRLSDLAVDMEGFLPTLVDRQDRQVLPTFLGATSLFPMPTLVKFLAHFSLAEFRLIYPRRPESQKNGSIYQGRIRIGNIVPHRRIWSIVPEKTFRELSASSDLDLYRAVQRWRREQDVPEQVFVSEKLRVNFKLWEIHKPQYIDFTSPSFVPILRACLLACPERLDLAEMLPLPAAFPAGRDGGRRAFEIQLESIAFEDPASPAAEFQRESLVVGGRLQMV